MSDDLQKELDDAIAEILASGSHRRLIVAGPGTGKTTLFKRVLEGGDKRQRLVMTFINNLKDELDSKLGTLAEVFTFHGYCHRLLRQHGPLRQGLSDNFHYYPGVASLVKEDWEIVYKKRPAPQFVGAMRDLQDNELTTFYLDRANYYDAVEYDDSIYRVHRVLSSDHSRVEAYELVLVDEFQDFNELEASFIELLAARSPVLIVGDDDQALYSQLRGASYDYIRGLHKGGDYACFTLPFCMRCPKAVVDNLNTIVARARERGHLKGRIDKPFKYFPAAKGQDSEKYPRIKVVRVSAQSLQVNYCGRYIAEAVDQISPDEIAQSWTEDFPTALVIGGVQYRRQISEYLRDHGYQVEEQPSEAPQDPRIDGLRMIHADPHSNLGWRLVLDMDRPTGTLALIRKSVNERNAFVDLVPEDYRKRILAEAEQFVEPEVIAASPPQFDHSRPRIKLMSFEGSKGLSAQHVFIVGLHNGELPRNPASVEDLEICKFIVALTRTRKECHVMWMNRFSGQAKQPSLFMNWMDSSGCRGLVVDKTYWQARETRT